jgi:hypothetical protein
LKGSSITISRHSNDDRHVLVILEGDHHHARGNR